MQSNRNNSDIFGAIYMQHVLIINSMLLRNDIVYLSALTKLFCFVKAII